jgi:hypothetical protein
MAKQRLEYMLKICPKCNGAGKIWVWKASRIKGK